MTQVNIRPFTVCLAKFRFLESDKHKLRPVIIIGNAYGARRILIAIPISSSSGTELVDVVLQNWQVAGLLKSSVARVHRLAAIAQEDLIEEIGSIDKKDQAAIRAALKELFTL